jgi:hypothetical protein
LRKISQRLTEITLEHQKSGAIAAAATRSWLMEIGMLVFSLFSGSVFMEWFTPPIGKETGSTHSNHGS